MGSTSSSGALERAATLVDAPSSQEDWIRVYTEKAYSVNVADPTLPACELFLCNSFFEKEMMVDVFSVSLEPFSDKVACQIRMQHLHLKVVSQEVFDFDRMQYIELQGDAARVKDRKWLDERKQRPFPFRVRFFREEEDNPHSYWRRDPVEVSFFVVPSELVAWGRAGLPTPLPITLYEYFYNTLECTVTPFKRELWELQSIPCVSTTRSLLMTRDGKDPSFELSSRRGGLVQSVDEGSRSFMRELERADSSKAQTSGATSAGSDEEGAETSLSRLLSKGRSFSESFGSQSWVPEAQPRALQNKQLFEYQLRALAWMKAVERRCYRGFGFGIDVPAGDGRFRAHGLDQSVIRCRLQSRGAVLADEMGLGKTLAMVSLILAHPRGSLHGAKEEDLPREKAGFEGGGTLVLCPSHLVNQWKEEIESVSSLTVERITTSSQWSKLTYQRLLDADIVLVSHSFLLNKTYITSVGSLDNPHLVEKGASTGRSTRRSRGATGGTSKDLTCAVLQKIDWHRIILDEGHEVIGTSDYRFEEMLFTFRSSYCWYVTGTPFPNVESFRAVERFLDCPIELDSDRPLRTGWPLYKTVREETFRRNLYWRNTKEGAEAFKHIPPVVEEVIFIRHTDVEAAMYNAAAVTNNRVRMRQLCCHPQISAHDRDVLGDEVQTLDEIRERLISHHAQQIAKLERERDARQKDLERARKNHRKAALKREIEFQELLEEHEGDEEAAAVVAFVKNRETRERVEKREEEGEEKKLARAEQAIIDEHKRGEFYGSLVPRASEQLKDPCLVCFEDIDRAGVTKCGHVFCIDCIRSAVSVHHNCPICRCELMLKDVTTISTEEGVEAPRTDALAIKHGAKMARLILLLRQTLQDEEAKVIVFSQWDALLHRIGSTLQDEGIPSVYCRGSVHMRNSTLKKFREGGPETPRVLMLSLDHAASGTNLTEASHVILVDPVDGSKKHADATETQAIGRAHRIGQSKSVRVIRLITRGTIEQELYERDE